MPKAAPKSNQIGRELIDMLKSKTKLDDFSFFKYLREIEKLRDRLSEDYLRALVCAASGRKKEAVEYFEASLAYGIETYASNYAVFISEHGTHKELLDLVCRLEKNNFSKILITYCWETNLFSGNIKSALVYVEKLISISEEKEAEAMRSDADGISFDSEKFKKNADLSDDSYQFIAQSAMEIADSYGVRASSLSFNFVPEEKTSAYILTMKTNDVEILSDMNVDIAFSLAGNESLMGKRFSVWFQSSGEELDVCL